MMRKIVPAATVLSIACMASAATVSLPVLPVGGVAQFEDFNTDTFAVSVVSSTNTVNPAGAVGSDLNTFARVGGNPDYQGNTDGDLVLAFKSNLYNGAGDDLFLWEIGFAEEGKVMIQVAERIFTPVFTLVGSGSNAVNYVGIDLSDLGFPTGTIPTNQIRILADGDIISTPDIAAVSAVLVPLPASVWGGMVLLGLTGLARLRNRRRLS